MVYQEEEENTQHTSPHSRHVHCRLDFSFLPGFGTQFYLMLEGQFRLLPKS